MKRVYFLFLLGLSLTTCLSKKDDPKPTTLPAITQKGANTFGCLINGEVMVAISKCGGGCPPNPRYDPSLGFGIYAFMDSTKGNPIYFVSIQLDNKFNEGIYQLDTIKNSPGSNIFKCDLNAFKFVGHKFSLSSTSGAFYRGQLHISKWVKGQSGFVAGTFWFDLYNPAQYPDTVRVREGRFDIPFN